MPDVVLKSVGYVCQTTHKSATTIEGDPYATGFFVTVPSAIVGKSLHYFVTAKHVAEDLVNHEIHFRVNAVGGGTTLVRDVYHHWILHPSDRTADVAVIPFTPHPKMDFVSIPIGMFATQEVIRTKNIGIGDEVFMTGLFEPAQADKRIMPIVRHGNIALIAGEQIQTELGYADVYLVEARSIGGISGSPVFVRETITLKGNCDDGSPIELSGVGDFFLLGLMHGHWDIKESGMNKAMFEHDRKHGVNMGIGIVVPATKILETINQK
ncbi:MAG TPA: hypothetical protein VG892_11690 [Terriglobales bacterium]|nr:hypothetical protein [Terriglobales bacterium]